MRILHADMEIVVICVVALFASLLTFFSGFGLGTILLPAFALFFPLDVAVALTAVVHFLNNVFKTGLIGKLANWQVVIRFGVFAAIAAVGGAILLEQLAQMEMVLSEYTISGHTFQITILNIVIGILLIFFALFDILPIFQKIEFDKKMLWLGGTISGFFGGLSGHQGALRSAFLIRLNLGKETFVATGIIIACVVDISRMAVYFTSGRDFHFKENYQILLAAVLASFAGAYFGRQLLKKVTITFVQYLVSGLIILLGILLALGII